MPSPCDNGTDRGARATAAIQAEICGAAGAKRADPLDIVYAERMRQLLARFPGDPDILSIYAEAELVATRADWWDRRTGQPAGRVGELADMLEQGLVLHPRHIGLNHYMIHTVDAVPVARRAEASADRLGGWLPSRRICCTCRPTLMPSWAAMPTPPASTRRPSPPMRPWNWN